MICWFARGLTANIWTLDNMCEISDPLSYTIEWLHVLKWNMSHLMTKPTKWHVRPAKTQISLGIRPVWSESLLSACRKLGSLATHWTHSEDSDQTGWMSRLIWVFAGRTCHFVAFITLRLILFLHNACQLLLCWHWYINLFGWKKNSFWLCFKFRVWENPKLEICSNSSFWKKWLLLTCLHYTELSQVPAWGLRLETSTSYSQKLNI